MAYSLDVYRALWDACASQLPVKHWHEALGNPTLADAILDRLVHQAHKILLKGESLRKKSALDTTGLNKELALNEIVN